MMSKQSIHTKAISRMLRKIAPIVVVWGVAMWLVLQLQDVSYGQEHSICGPWGSGPPVSVLAACHGFWLVLLGPPVITACTRLNPQRVIKWGVLGLMIGIAAMCGIAIWEATHWLPESSALQRGYFVQRWLFAVAVHVDLPVYELTAFGLLGVLCGWARLHGSAFIKSRHIYTADSRGERMSVIGTSSFETSHDDR